MLYQPLLLVRGLRVWQFALKQLYPNQHCPRLQNLIKMLDNYNHKEALTQVKRKIR